MKDYLTRHKMTFLGTSQHIIFMTSEKKTRLAHNTHWVKTIGH